MRSRMDPAAAPGIHVFDFFSGAGGTSAGLRAAGMRITLGLDNDPDAAATFRGNFPETPFLEGDITDIDTEAISQLVSEARDRGDLLFSACAPCQPFSRQNSTQRDLSKHRSLLLEFLRFVDRYLPQMVFVENVPGLQDPDETREPFGPFVRALRARHYHVTYGTVDCRRYGVPQRRLRLVLVASLLGPIRFPNPTHGPGTRRGYTTVRHWIGSLPPIAAGEQHPRIANHRAMALSPLNLRRIRATPMGGDRRNWPRELVLDCHRSEDAGYVDVYGRMDWNGPATGLTTKCISLSNGRFGHPDQDRAISVREAACLQTFPRRFKFEGPIYSMARQIGNAVPVLLARRFGEEFDRHRSTARTPTA
jgi:DNA (cytosine-5)-methyltransferase 1